MKPTGIIRKVDHLGRIVIPKELRLALDMDEGVALEILADDGDIILRRYSPDDVCIVTGEVDADNLKFADGNVVLTRAAAADLAEEILETLVE